jgi:hypothetical protein
LFVAFLVPGPRSLFPPFLLSTPVPGSRYPVPAVLLAIPQSEIRNAFPRSRRSRRARKSHFCRITYVNGRAQKQRVF